MRRCVSYFEDESGLYSHFRTFKVADHSGCNSEPTTNNHLNKSTTEVGPTESLICAQWSASPKGL